MKGKTIIVTPAKSGKATVEVRDGAEKTGIEQWQLDEEKDKVTEAEDKLGEVRKELELFTSNENLIDLSELSVIPTGTGVLAFSTHKASLLDEQIIEALEAAYKRVGGIQLLGVLEALG